jgi:predicted nucleotidyltransferase
MAMIYGSFAKGGQRKDSDVDLLIVGKPRVENKLLTEIVRLEKHLQREINYKLYSEDEYRQKRGKGNPFLEEVLTDRRILLKGDPHAV